MGQKVQVVELVEDRRLSRKEAQATAAFRRFFKDAPPLKLYRTADGRVGFQAQVFIAPGDRERFQQAYAAVMGVLGAKRGRPAGLRKVQAKLRLEERIYRALKARAKETHTSVSGLVEDLAHKAHIV